MIKCTRMHLRLTQNLTLTLDDLAHQSNWPPGGQKLSKNNSWKSDLGNFSKLYGGGWDPQRSIGQWRPPTVLVALLYLIWVSIEEIAIKFLGANGPFHVSSIREKREKKMNSPSYFELRLDFFRISNGRNSGQLWTLTSRRQIFPWIFLINCGVHPYTKGWMRLKDAASLWVFPW